MRVVYPDNARRGAACCAPTPRHDRCVAGYFLGCSGGVKPMTWTPAPCAMSIACITSTYLRFGAALMNSSLAGRWSRSEEHTSELQSQSNLVCRLLLEKKKHN